MKARKKGTDHPFEEVEYVQLRDSYVIIKADQMEFENESQNCESDNIDYWDKLRHQAAIAAMQGILANSRRTINRNRGDFKTETFFYSGEIASMSVDYANALIEELKSNSKR